ncbi:MAG: universal stress protein [Bacteroidales bacterium]|nr:universal stress protein [Bacteroidales bacterium]
MKTLVVAYDFSKNAEHALEYAMFFAQHLSATIHLVWIDNSTTNEMLDTIEEELRIEKKNYLKGLITDWAEKLPAVTIKYHLGKGKIYQEVSKTATRLKADLLFTGTHGISGYEQYWIGSNAYRITTSAPCPVVTVRCNYEVPEKLTNILLPLDSSLETRKKLPFAVKMAEIFGARIHLLKLYNSPLGVIRKRIDQFGEEAKKYMDDSDVPYILSTKEANNVATAILNYSDENKIDLITIMTEQETTTASRFLGPYAQQLINSAAMPVMSLRATYYEQDED